MIPLFLPIQNLNKLTFLLSNSDQMKWKGKPEKWVAQILYLKFRYWNQRMCLEQSGIPGCMVARACSGI